MAKIRRLKWFAFILFFVLLLPFLYCLWVPDVSKLKKEKPQKTAFMEYRERESKEKGKKYRIHQVWVPLSNISHYLIKAVLIAEDDNFWRHEGFDYEAIQKAIEKDIKVRRFKFGGSTISQQLARNLYLSPAKNPFRKIREAILTWRMERALPKRRILELYLNVVEWGEGIFGVEAASKHYYGKPSSELTPQEAVRLVSVLPNPRKYNPTGDQRYVINRSNLIYGIMIQRGIVIPEYDEVMERSESLAPIENPRLSD
ncbi:MAG: monofunctional biosynthetic peptidoglycan transglycosylase [Thermodesulfobacteriota bacterium]